MSAIDRVLDNLQPDVDGVNRRLENLGSPNRVTLTNTMGGIRVMAHRDEADDATVAGPLTIGRVGDTLEVMARTLDLV